MAETQSGQGVLSAAQQDVRASVAGFAGVSIQATGTFSGTISFEGSIDGVNFAALLVSPIGVATAVTSATAAGLWTGTCAGLQVVRVRMSSFSSGTVLVHIKSVLSSPGGSGSGGGGGGGGVVQISDGSNPAILATVRQYADSNPLAVQLTDSNGDPIAGSAVTIADGADVTEGAIANTAVTGDNTGTVSAKLRGFNKIWADVWDSSNHWLKVSIQNATLAVTQSGSWVISAGSALIGKVGIDQTTPGTTNAVAVTTAVTLKRVAITASSSGDNTAITAVGGKKLTIVAFEISFSGTVNAKFTDGASGTNLGGLYYGVANAGAANSCALPSFLFQGTVSTALVINLSGATAIGGGITYYEE